MLNTLRVSVAAAAAAVALLMFQAAPAAAEGGGPIAPNVGIEYRAVGVVFAEDAEKVEWPAAVVMGGALELEIFAIGRNRVGLGVSYMRFLGEETEGTAQIDVTSIRQQVDLTVLYRFHWTYLSLFAQAGASAGIFSAVTRIYRLGAVIPGDDDSYGFSSRTPVTEEKAVGTVWGGLVAVGVQLDLGRLFSARGRKLDNFLFWNLVAQYSIRNLRHESGGWTSLSIYPMRLKK